MNINKEFFDSLVRNDRLWMGVTVGVTAAASLITGYKLAERRLYDLADEEIAAFKEQWPAVYEEMQVARKNDDRKSAIDIAAEHGYAEIRDEITAVHTERMLPPPGVVINNVFEQAEAQNDYATQAEVEALPRREDEPHILSKNEYFANETDYAQVELTYYAGDGVLCNMHDEVMEIPITVGDENLKFGHGSEDENVVYVRNDKLQVEYEVTKSEGKYAHEVLGAGVENELRHSQTRRVTRRLSD